MAAPPSQPQPDSSQPQTDSSQPQSQTDPTQTETEPDLGLGSDAEEILAQELSSNAEASHVVRRDVSEVASGLMAGLELANDQLPTQPEEEERAVEERISGLGLDLGPPSTGDETPILPYRPMSPLPSIRRHHRGLTSPLMRMTPAMSVFPTSGSEVSPSSPLPPVGAESSQSRTTSSSRLAPPRVSSPHPRVSSPTPPPSVRVRALSHPDIMDLCASFAARPGMTRTRTYSAQGDDEWDLTSRDE